MATKNKQSFEAALAELEEIAKRLETENLSLEDSMSLFERGIKLSRECGRMLDEAKQRIETLGETEEAETI